MPALTAFIGANATQYKTVMGEVAAISERAAAATLASFRTVETQLKTQMALVSTATVEWEMYAASLASVQAAMAKIEVATATNTATMLGQSTVFAATPNLTAEEKYVADYKRLLDERDMAAKALKAEQLSTLVNIASAGGVASAFGHGGGPGGGISGIMRETLVIFRELGRGNLTRVPGSVTLLAQYMGILGKLVKSTAQESIIAAAAENKLAGSMAATALAAEEKATATAAAARIEVVDVEAANALAAASEREAVALRLAAIAQAEKARATQTAAEISTAGASVSISALGYITAGVVALGAAAFFTWRHFHRLQQAFENYTALNLKDHLEAEAEAEKKSAEAVQANIDWLEKITNERQRESEAIMHNVEMMQKEADMRREILSLRGASNLQLELFDEQELAKQRDYLDTQLDILKAKLNIAEADEGAAEKQASNVGFLTKIGAAQKNEAVYDAVQEFISNNPELQDLMARQQLGEGTKPVKETPSKIGALLSGSPGAIVGGLAPSGQTVDQRISELMGKQTMIKVGNKPMLVTPADITAVHDSLQALLTAQQKYEDAVKEHKDNVQKLAEDVIKVRQRLTDTEDELKMKQEYGRTEALLRKDRGGGGGESPNASASVLEHRTLLYYRSRNSS